MPQCRFQSGNESIQKATTVTNQLLILRTLILLEAYKNLATENSLENDAVVYALGMGEWVDNPDTYSKKRFVSEVRKRHKGAENNTKLKFPKRLKKNVKTLSEVIGLNKLEKEILMFLVMTVMDRGLQEALGLVTSFGFSELNRVIGTVLNRREEDISEALSDRGKLIKASILKRSTLKGITLSFDGHLEFVTDNFPSRMIKQLTDVKDIFKDVFVKMENSDLTLAHYQYIQSYLQVLVSYLNTASGSGIKGINILIEGPPGTGKTELTKVIAEHLGLSLYGISTENEKGEGHSGLTRMHAQRVAQTVLKPEHAILVFDECEDVFGNERTSSSSDISGDKHKGWINRALEENTVICFWLTNSVTRMDSAYIRRFDTVLSLGTPDVKQRHEILRNICNDQFDDSFIRKLSESDTLTPAVVERAIKIVNVLEEDSLEQSREEVVINLVNSTLKAQGNRPLNRYQNTILPNHYQTTFTNAKDNTGIVDLDVLVERLRLHSNARLLIHGPPGTGKTAFAHFLAQRSGRKVLAKKGSDLISPYVGGTEANIARFFNEAASDDYVVLVDEVDTFLFSRDDAVRSWEVTAVNEFLVNTEEFSGLLIATTNRKDHLDRASMRRFDLQLKFDYLQTKQVLELYETVTMQLNISSASSSQIENLSGLTRITPGDFQMLIRQSRFKPFETSESLIKALIQIDKSKRNQSNPIGFVHST
ncbi:MAG: ATP-binding protein [Candidatus Thiodiazotropha sp. DIVDIV]